MNYECITVTEKYDGAVTEIALGPTPANILSEKAMEEITHQLQEIENVSHKKLVIFTGQGKHFCFGASVEEHKPGAVQNMLPGFHKFIDFIINYKTPTIARVTGLCLGGGFELALACTFIYADDSAKFAVPEIQLGVFPPVASILLPCKGCDQLSSYMILTGEQVTAEELERQGVIQAVTLKGDLDTLIDEFVTKQLVPKSASSLRIAHTASRMFQAQQYKTFIGKLEELYLNDLMNTHDGVEGIEAFLGKRSPQWKHE